MVARKSTYTICKCNTQDFIFLYRLDLVKREGCGVVAHERLTELRVTME